MPTGRKHYRLAYATRTKIRYLVLITLLVGVLASHSGLSQTDHSPDPITSIFDSLQTMPRLDVTILTDMKELLRKRSSEDYQGASIAFRSIDKTWTLPVKVRLRGNSRREICYNPPLMLKFDSITLSNHGFDPDFNKIKLVVPCKNSEQYEEILYRELLIYKLYSILTPYSFQACEASLTITDAQGKRKDITGPAFMIEDYDQLAQRLGGPKYKPNVLHPSKVWDNQEILMAMFQYMIGNTDWNIANSHNIKLVRSYTEEELIPVPYDFDYSGLVDAPYAVPFETLPIESVRQRLYLGLCRTETELEEIAAYFLSKKEAILECISEYPPLNTEQRTRCLDYIDEFFEDLDDTDKLARNTRSNCID